MSLNKDGNILDDASELLSILNDNDLEYIDQHKKKLASRNTEVLPDELRHNRKIFVFYDPQ